MQTGTEALFNCLTAPKPSQSQVRAYRIEFRRQKAYMRFIESKSPESWLFLEGWSKAHDKAMREMIPKESGVGHGQH